MAAVKATVGLQMSTFKDEEVDPEDEDEVVITEGGLPTPDVRRRLFRPTGDDA